MRIFISYKKVCLFFLPLVYFLGLLQEVLQGLILGIRFPFCKYVIYFKYLGQGPAHSGCCICVCVCVCVFSKTSSVGYGGLCKVCLKIHVLLDFVCVLL